MTEGDIKDAIRHLQVGLALCGIGAVVIIGVVGMGIIDEIGDVRRAIDKRNTILEKRNIILEEQNIYIQQQNDLIKKNAMRYEDAATLYDTVQRVKPVRRSVQTR